MANTNAYRGQASTDRGRCAGLGTEGSAGGAPESWSIHIRPEEAALTSPSQCWLPLENGTLMPQLPVFSKYKSPNFKNSFIQIGHPSSALKMDNKFFKESWAEEM